MSLVTDSKEDYYTDEYRLSRGTHFEILGIEQKQRKQLAADMHARTEQNTSGISVVFISTDAELKIDWRHEVTLEKLGAEMNTTSHLSQALIRLRSVYFSSSRGICGSRHLI